MPAANKTKGNDQASFIDQNGGKSLGSFDHGSLVTTGPHKSVQWLLPSTGQHESQRVCRLRAYQVRGPRSMDQPVRPTGSTCFQHGNLNHWDLLLLYLSTGHRTPSFGQCAIDCTM
ncbi:uncharacterized protein PADG_01171 [Paracoccidioides brasiliensis Pb18]|uniref:Uncharacterized protein n=1 Tax=Paracoccidioides brasiliensis (strain Pb18) TaxID=502780 RepID=C1FZE5_PARBD|nr:uncharacterized protein PADG_01171 [Paracoccidioides brasiliensis Pb18]EEH44882.2 hypothetical protein PADG_01171 [Paracoccidioides brasiliensis Pb18]